MKSSKSPVKTRDQLPAEMLVLAKIDHKILIELLKDAYLILSNFINIFLAEERIFMSLANWTTNPGKICWLQMFFLKPVPERWWRTAETCRCGYGKTQPEGPCPRAGHTGPTGFPPGSCPTHPPATMGIPPLLADHPALAARGTEHSESLMPACKLYKLNF